MIIIDEDLLDEFRAPGPCEWCGKPCLRREPHHIFARGMGGGGRLDIRCNLVSLGSTILWECTCHQAAHAGAILRLQLLLVVGQRECCLVSDIEEEVWLLRRERPVPRNGRLARPSQPRIRAG
jgi:hypothetical protein